MSLINQVLRDLDQRHASAVAVPAAVRAPARAVGSRRGRNLAWGALAVAALAMGVGAVSLNSASRAVAPAALPAAPAATPLVAAGAPAASAASIRTPIVIAKAEPTIAKTPDAAPAPLLAVAPMAAPVASAANVPTPAPVGEARIEKRAPARTAHERAEANYQRGAAAHQQSQLADAETAYAAALREEAGYAPARQALSGLLIAQGLGDEAKVLLSDGLALAPREPGLAMMLARLLAEHGELQRAADVLQAAAVNSPSPEDCAFHAAILQRLNRHAEAAVMFAAALRVMPNNGVWWMGLGMSLAADARNGDAREAFSRARASGGLTPELASYIDQRLRQLL